MKKYTPWVLLAAALAMTACHKMRSRDRAVAKIEPKSGSTLTGTATFQLLGDHVHVTVKVEHAPPGEHGVHVHEKGDCTDPEAKSAGAHFNPQGMQHGSPMGPMHHPGDFGNLTVGADGKGTLELDSKSVSVDPHNPLSVLDRAIVVHEKADDFSQPAGNAGARIGCGVIRME